MSVAPPSGQDRLMIYGPKSDGTYIIEFRTADGDSLAISVPAGETRVLKHFQARMPYGLVVPEVASGKESPGASLYRVPSRPHARNLRDHSLDALIVLQSANHPIGCPKNGSDYPKNSNCVFVQ
jgi:hypothetical protein